MGRSNNTTSRADAIRQRRSSRAKGSGTNRVAKRKQKTGSTYQPPVLVRGGREGVVNREAKRGGRARVKRRYDVALGTAGAEMRLPSLPVASIGWRLFSGLLSAALAFLIYLAWNTPELQVRAAEVQGLKRLSGADINVIADVAGKPIFTVQPKRVEEDLQLAFPEISSVTVKTSLPAGVKIVLEERLPVLAWEQDGQTWWLDKTGFAFQQRDGTEPPAVRVRAEDSVPSATIQGETASERSSKLSISPELVSAVLQLSKEAPEGKPLIYSHEHGLGWKDGRGWEVYFGTDIQDIDMKLQVYKAILKEIKKKDVRPIFISVEFVHAPYYRLEQ